LLFIEIDFTKHIVSYLRKQGETIGQRDEKGIRSFW
jgi:hypothetical protein